MKSNLAPADEIQKIREQVKALRKREADLKALLISGEAAKEGHFVRARLLTRKSRRFDRKAAEAELGDLSRFSKETETIVLKLETITDDDDDFDLIE